MNPAARLFKLPLLTPLGHPPPAPGPGPGKLLCEFQWKGVPQRAAYQGRVCLPGSLRFVLDKPEACLCGSQSPHFVTISVLPVFRCTEGPSDINKGTHFRMASLRPHDLHRYVSMLSIGSSTWYLAVESRGKAPGSLPWSKARAKQQGQKWSQSMGLSLWQTPRRGEWPLLLVLHELLWASLS